MVTPTESAGKRKRTEQSSAPKSASSPALSESGAWAVFNGSHDSADLLLLEKLFKCHRPKAVEAAKVCDLLSADELGQEDSDPTKGLSRAELVLRVARAKLELSAEQRSSLTQLLDAASKPPGVA